MRTLTPKALAERWQCSEQHIRNQISKGHLPAFRAGGKLLRIRLCDVEDIECGSSSCTEGNTASHGTDRMGSDDVIALTPQTRQRQPAAPRLDTPSLRGREARR
jgi:excisionase family DNA binding protein